MKKKKSLEGYFLVSILFFIAVVGYFLVKDDEPAQKVTKENKNNFGQNVVINSLHPIKVDGLTGFINQDGVIVIEPQFNRVIVDQGYAHDDLIPVRKDKKGKVGYIDKTGSFVIEPIFDSAFPFKESRALIIIDEKAGYIDLEGNYIVKPTYSLKGFPLKEGIETLFFNEGFAPVQVDGKGWGYINVAGDIVIKPTFQFANAFSAGVAPVKIDGLFGYINKAGDMVIEPKYKHALPFSEELAAVKVDNKYGFINVAGEMKIKPEYSRVNSFREGLAAVFKELKVNGGKTDLGTIIGYINKAGDVVIPLEIDKLEGDDIHDFSFYNGLAIGKKSWSMFHFINMEGEEVIKMYGYNQLSPFSYGLAKGINYQMKIETYVDKKGNIVYSNKKVK